MAQLKVGKLDKLLRFLEILINEPTLGALSVFHICDFQTPLYPRAVNGPG